MVMDSSVAPPPSTPTAAKKKTGSLRRFLSLGSARPRRVETAFLPVSPTSSSPSSDHSTPTHNSRSSRNSSPELLTTSQKLRMQPSPAPLRRSCSQQSRNSPSVVARQNHLNNSPVPPVPNHGQQRSSPFTPDTSLVLEERKEQLKRHDWKEAGLPPAPPHSRRRIVRTNFLDEEWSGDGGKPSGRSSSTSDPPGRLEEENSRELAGSGAGGTGSGSGSGRSRTARSREEALRRHTLGAPDRYSVRAMDLEMGTKSNRRKSPQPRGYPPPPNMLLDDDPGIMSEVETSSTGFRRGNKQRSSLPVVRTPSKTLERPLGWFGHGTSGGVQCVPESRRRPPAPVQDANQQNYCGLVFLQYRSETKRALLPNEITSIDTVKALFVRSFPKQLTMEYMESPHVKIYIHDSSKDMFYELEDLRSHLRDIRDRSVLRLFESDDVVSGLGMGLGIAPGTIPTWDQDQSYFSEPEFDSDYQHQHIHKTKGSKSNVGGHTGPPYYMTHSFPPGGGGGGATLPRGAGGSTASLIRSYQTTPKPVAQPVDGYMSSPERSTVASRGYPPGPGYGPTGSYDDPYYAGYASRPGAITPVIDEEASDTEGIDDNYVTSAPTTYKMRPAGASFPPTVVPQALDQTRLRVEHMERQLASLTGLVQKALNQQTVPGCTTPTPGPPPPHIYHRSASVTDEYDKQSSSSSASLPDKSVSFEKSVSFSDEPPDMNSPKQHSPQHSADTKPTKPAIKSSTLPRMSSQDRDRHKPTPPPKPVSLSPGQYESRNVYRDLQLTAEMYNHLRGLQKKAKDLRQEVRNLRRMSQTQAHTVRETLRDAFLKIRSVLVSAGGEGLWSPGGDEARIQMNREGDLYRQQMLRLESDLTELEGTVEELRGNVINRKTRVNMSDVEAMALVLSKSSKTVAELKLRFPSLQDAIKNLIGQEMDRVVTEEKFLKEEPERLDSALRRCKKLTGTLVTLKRLASVQEQRLPDSRLSPPPDETPPVTPTSGKEPCGGEGAAQQFCGTGGLSGGGVGGSFGSAAGGGACRAENPLDALLDELQNLGGSSSSAGGSTSSMGSVTNSGSGGLISGVGGGGGGGSLRRLHSYPCEQGVLTSSGRALPPAPPPRTSSKSPSSGEENSTLSSTLPNAARQQMLEAKHQELLKKQRALQEQYTRLQSLQRAPPPDLLQLKKTGSESNLLGKMGLTLAPTGSLSSLTAPIMSTTGAAASVSTTPATGASTTTTAKIYETDIL